MKKSFNRSIARKLLALVIALSTVLLLASCEIPDISGYLNGFFVVGDGTPITPPADNSNEENESNNPEGGDKTTEDEDNVPEVVPCVHEKAQTFTLECVFGNWFYATECVHCTVRTIPVRGRTIGV